MALGGLWQRSFLFPFCAPCPHPVSLFQEFSSLVTKSPSSSHISSMCLWEDVILFLLNLPCATGHPVSGLFSLTSAWFPFILFPTLYSNCKMSGGQLGDLTQIGIRMRQTLGRPRQRLPPRFPNRKCDYTRNKYKKNLMSTACCLQ